MDDFGMQSSVLTFIRKHLSVYILSQLKNSEYIEPGESYLIYQFVFNTQVKVQDFKADFQKRVVPIILNWA